MTAFVLLLTTLVLMPLALVGTVGRVRSVARGRLAEYRVDGLPRDLSVRAIVERSGAETVLRTVVQKPIVPPLDLGLLVQNQGTPAVEEAELGIPDHEDHRVGDDALDDAFRIAADEARRVEKLLSPEARRLLLAAAARGTACVTDHFVRIESVSDPKAFVEWALPACEELARAILAGRDKVPSARALRVHSRGYRALASTLGLAFGRTPLGLSGTFRDHEVFVGARRLSRRVYEGLVVADFPTPLGLGLEVRGATQLSMNAGSGGVDFLVGNPRFDAVFVVKGDEPLEVLARLTPEVQSTLLSLADAGAVELTDSHVMFRSPAVPGPDAVEGLLERVIRVADVVSAHLGREKLAAGPYR